MKMYLNEYAIITKGNHKNYQFWGNNEIPYELFLSMEQEKKISTLREHVAVEMDDLRKVFSEDTLDKFCKTRILVPDQSDVESVYSRRQAFYNTYGYEDAGKKLASKHVLIMGCGGIGTHMAWHMAVMGVGKITLLDFDIIEKSNLNRQILFSLEDVGNSKVSTLKERIEGINQDIIIQTLNKKITSEEDIESVCDEVHPDLIIKALDSPAEFPLWLDHICKKKKIPYVAGITMRDNVMIGPTFIPDKSEIGWSDIVDLSNHADKIHGTSPSLGMLLYHISDELSVETFKILSGHGDLNYSGKIVLKNLISGKEEILTAYTGQGAEINNKREAKVRQETSDMKTAILGCIMTAIVGILGEVGTSALLGLVITMVLPHFVYTKRRDIVKYTLALAVIFSLVFGTVIVHREISTMFVVGGIQLVSFISFIIGAISATVFASCMVNYIVATVRKCE